MEQNLIIGIHSIRAALDNPRRRDFELFVAEDGRQALAAVLVGRDDVQQRVLTKHDFQQKAKELCQRLGFDYQRVPGNAMLLCSAAGIISPTELYHACNTQASLKLIILDGVTDAHNAAAIVRTASFYGIHIVLCGQKFGFGLSPSFFKMACGGSEYLSLVQVGNLPGAVKKIQGQGVVVFALAQQGQGEFPSTTPPKVGLVLGGEGQGISHALSRQCPQQVGLRPWGQTPSLNVSVAAAIAMERLFGQGEMQGPKKGELD